MSINDLLANMHFNLGTPQEEDQKLLMNSEFVRKLIDSIPEALLILNKDREAIFSNTRLLNFIGTKDFSGVLGKLPGQLLNCRHAMDMDGAGCGKTASCKYCGLFNATDQSLKGKDAQEECRVLTIKNEALDLKVWATPLKINEKAYTIITLMDNSSEKRRETLERVFFHDIMNSAGGVFGLAKLMKESPEIAEQRDIPSMIYISTEHLIEEIRSQQQLKKAENNSLEVGSAEMMTGTLLEDVIKLYVSHPVAKGIDLKVSHKAENLKITTDPVLVRRVVGNMTKNALEASKKGDTVTLSCTLSGRGVVFTVNNPGVIPDEVKLQLFNRSYSTKGEGRGIGTYSMKLFGEKYLKGKVSFESNDWTGTTFIMELPNLF